jgi:hypothetical protein
VAGEQELGRFQALSARGLHVGLVQVEHGGWANHGRMKQEPPASDAEDTYVRLPRHGQATVVLAGVDDELIDATAVEDQLLKPLMRVDHHPLKWVLGAGDRNARLVGAEGWQLDDVIGRCTLQG